MSQETERKDKITSGILTTVISIGLFLFIWFYNFNFELPPEIMEEGAVAISLGEPDAGGPEAVPVDAFSKPSVPQMSEPEPVEQTIDPEAVATKKTIETKKKKEEPKEVDDLLNQLNKGKQNQKPANSGGGDKPGTQGDPDGVNGGDPNGTVNSNGTSVSSTFKGRVFRRGSTSKKCNQEGKVILDVILMPDGKIKFESINPASTGSSCLDAMAIDYLRSSSFNASNNPVSVEGTITFTFKLK
jgi:TonB family protein